MRLLEIDQIPQEDRVLYFNKSELLSSLIFLKPDSKSDTIQLLDRCSDFITKLSQNSTNCDQQVESVVRMMERHKIFNSKYSRGTHVGLTYILIGIGHELGQDYRDDLLPGLVSKTLINLNYVSTSTQNSQDKIRLLTMCVSTAMGTGAILSGEYQDKPRILDPFEKFVRTLHN